MGCNKSFINVNLLGLAFMLIFTAFQTMGNIQQTFLSSIKDEDPSFTGEGYTSLSIIYAVFAISNWCTPSLISLFGPKIAMLYGSVTYLFFILTFLWPKNWLLYLASSVIGTGAAMIWTGQGNYLTLNSSQRTIDRNSGIFWAMLQLSMFAGNVFVSIKFKGKDKIDSSSRTFVIWTLTGIAIAGVIVMILLPRPPKNEDMDESEALPVEEAKGPIETLKGAIKLFFTKNMILLNVAFLYTGVSLSFYSGVYGSCLGFTENFEDRKGLVGLSGVFVGLGEVLGGVTFGILASKTTKLGRDPIVIAGFILHIISYFLIFLNIPNSAPFKDTNESAFITSIPELALFCSFLLGLGDACYNTQIYSTLGSVFSTNSASAFAIFKFTQSVGAATSFGYSSALVLYGQLGILLILAILGTTCYVIVEWSVKKEKAAESLSSSNESISE